MTQEPISYKASGVDIDNYMRSLDGVKSKISATAIPGVLKDVGAFGGIFDIAAAGVKNPYLVSSIDGVGTKLKVAQMAGKFDTIGKDLIFHCCNDILVQGARPLFFLDYFGTGTLDGKIFAEVITGLAAACKEMHCALIGGETAEMPGLYTGSEFDLVGTIIGIVDRDKVVTGEKISAGNVVLGIPSVGLHTNGFSLARKILFEVKKYKVTDRIPELGATLGEELLKPHRPYGAGLLPLIDAGKILGMAHITGGGLPDNVVRVLPENITVSIEKQKIKPLRLPIFDLMQRDGNVAEDEMYHVFNMGVGMVVIVDEKDAGVVLSGLQKFWPQTCLIGGVSPRDKGRKPVELV